MISRLQVCFLSRKSSHQTLSRRICTVVSRIVGFFVVWSNSASIGWVKTLISILCLLAVWIPCCGVCGHMDVNVSESTNSFIDEMEKDSNLHHPVPPVPSGNDSGSHKQVLPVALENDSGSHKPVPAGASGEGLPYAPVDWPNPGDVWTWKVGNRINSLGNHTHRNLIVPKGLQLKAPTRSSRWLGSKNAVIQFLKSEFPEADIDAFFASFTWEIPGEIGSAQKVSIKTASRKSTPKQKSLSSQSPSKKLTPKKLSLRSQSSSKKSTPEKRTVSSGKIDNVAAESANGFMHEMGKDSSLPKPVPPCSSGEGLPYAPIDWPNPGDVWSWNVGNKISPSGYYIHRHLLVPKRLQKIPTRKIWLGSKKAVRDFLTSEFPEADIDAFFALFTWEIAAEIGSEPKLKTKSSAMEAKPKKTLLLKMEPDPGSQTVNRSRDSANSDPVWMPKKEAKPNKEAVSVCCKGKRKKNSARSNSGSKRKKVSTPKNDLESRSQLRRSARSSAKKYVHLGDEDEDEDEDEYRMDVVLGDGVSAGHQSLGNSNEKDHIFYLDAALATSKGATGQSGSSRRHRESDSAANNIDEMSAEDFDNYLNSLDDIIRSVVKPSDPDSSWIPDNDDFNKIRVELSSLLSEGIPNVVTSNKLPLLTCLASKLQSDPDLSPEELYMLELIGEIPQFSDRIVNARQAITEASKFFSELETNLAIVSKLKSKYTLSKDKIAVLQAENASNEPSIEELDQQIAKLQSRRAMIAKSVEENKAEINELTLAQRRILNSLPKIVNEVQISNGEKSIWEAKQKEATQQEAQLLAKFAPLQGCSFLRN